MKLYFFNPNDYGNEYMVMSDSKEKALDSVKEYLFKDVKESGFKSSIKLYNKWKDVTIDNLPDEYSIDEFENDVVINTFCG